MLWPAVSAMCFLKKYLELQQNFLVFTHRLRELSYKICNTDAVLFERDGTNKKCEICTGLNIFAAAK